MVKNVPFEKIGGSSDISKGATARWRIEQPLPTLWRGMLASILHKKRIKLQPCWQ
jgi:hypothetical protein